MRAARFSVSCDLIAEALHLPAGATITGATFDDQPGCIWLTVHDPDLPDADEAHDAQPVITRGETTFDWGIR